MKYWVFDEIGLLRKFYTKAEAASFARVFGYRVQYVKPIKPVFEDAPF